MEREQRGWVYRYDGMPVGRSALNLTHARITAVLRELAVMLGWPDFFEGAPPGINAANGFVTFDGQGRPSLLPHHPDQRQQFVLAGHWEPLVRPDDRLIRQLVSGCFAGAPDATRRALALAEVGGAVAAGLVPSLKEPKAIILLGERGANGKSQVLDSLAGLVPADAVSALPITDLGRHRFAIRLVGKLLNISAELDSERAVDSARFKSVVTGDPITARDPYRPSVSFRPSAVHVFACNLPPSFLGGMGRPITRRLLVIRFDREIPAAEQIAELGKRIGVEEADALVWYAVRGASRLIRRGRFSEPRSSREALEQWRREADPVLGFLEDDEVVRLVPGSDAPRVRSRVVYDRFRAWVSAHGYGKPPDIVRFVRRVVAAGRGITSTRDAKGRYLLGLKLVGK